MQIARISVLTLLVMSALAACASPSAGSAAPSKAPSGDIEISAKFLRFEPAAIEIPAAKGFTIRFDNKDAATVHDIDIHRNDPNGEVVFDGATLPGPAATTYELPALSAGTYAFVCSVHPGEMRGTMNAK